MIRQQLACWHFIGDGWPVGSLLARRVVRIQPLPALIVTTIS